MPISSQTKNRLKEALQALDHEIEAVLQKPVSETLHDGEYLPKSGTGENWDYRFKTATASLRFVESVRTAVGNESVTLPLVTSDTETIVLRFSADQGPTIGKLQIEWENDFVLRKVRDTLSRLESADSSEEGLSEALWHPERCEVLEGGFVAEHDGSLNERQAAAVQKALDYPVTFIWGPPGTGKTATLGYVVANAMLFDHRVLFASNTNRAVDVGCLSAIHALERMGVVDDAIVGRIARFGEPALEDPHLAQFTFEKHLEKAALRGRDRAARNQEMLDELDQLEASAEKAKRDGYAVPREVEHRIDQILERIEMFGGREALEDRIEKAVVPNELSVLRSMRLVCTTLARVCTSELLGSLRFDVVVIDEASMASLPYVMALASRADTAVIFAGDPMQLPPISVTDHGESREYLEEDVFSRVSGAKSTADLFRWHDANPHITSFFDVQYRMRDDMAGLISQVFYEGRLKSSDERTEASPTSASVQVIDTALLGPVLEQREGGKGFQPVNRVHGEIALDTVRRLVMESGIPPIEIGIIVPFRSGVYAYRRWLRDQGLDQVEVGTIHTFQGREKRAILFDTVMTGEVTSSGHVRHFSVRPFDEAKNGLSVPRLLNVALSRAKDRLILLADMRHIRAVYQGKFLGMLFERALQMAQTRKPLHEEPGI